MYYKLKRYSSAVFTVRFLIGFLFGAAIFLLIGIFLPITTASQIRNIRGAVLRESTASYQYIDPLLSCEVGSEDAFPELSPIKSALQKDINADIAKGDASQISVYFRTLNGSKWFEINGNQPYAPASLLKIFVMMAYFKEADATDNPALLQQKVRFEGSSNPEEDTPGEIIPHLTNGKDYTIEQLIEQMIIYSDNDALNTLVDHFDSSTVNYFALLFKDLNIPSPVTQNEDTLAFMTADAYAMSFRVLYSSTYLSERYSEKALSILAQAHYKDGLVDGVPSAVQVAHKFGLTTIPAANGKPAQNQLHDCGIIYNPGHPYLLCIMTSGNSFGPLQRDIQELSATAYKSYASIIK